MAKAVSQITTIMAASLKSIARQKAMLFSSLVLPMITLLSTWWVTVDEPMLFKLASGGVAVQSMLNIHILTGGLTAVAITAGIFGFLLTVDNQKTADRLIIMGYSPATITIGWLLSLITILSFAGIVTFGVTVLLYWPTNPLGVFIATFLTTIIYATIGYVVGSIYPRIMEGTLIVLVFSFIDLMMLSNPMGVNVYLKSWTYYLPGFWPTQLVLEAGFFNSKISFVKPVELVFLETLILLMVPVFYKTQMVQTSLAKVRRWT